jgi:hypothetical protein
MKIWMQDGKFKELTADEIKGLTPEQLGEYTADKNKHIIDETKNSLNQKIEEAKKGSVSKEDYEAFKTEIQGQLDGLTIAEEVKTELNRKHAELIDKLKEQGLDIAKLKGSTEGMSEKDKVEFSKASKSAQFRYLMNKAFETDEYKRWVASDMRSATPKMDVKAVTGLAADHTGTIFITEPVNNVRDIPRTQPHMRDYLSVGQTDETNITFPEVTDYNDIYTLGTQMLTENEEITDVSFKSKENTSTVVRMGVSMNVSKRYFRGRSGVIIDHVLAQVPDAMMFKEDVQVLHGDGSGSNLNGILTDARAFDLTPKSYTAGQIASVATYDGGTKALITFTVAHELLSGDSITIANATETTYNATHKDILLIDEKSIVINLTYVAEADTSAWTGDGLSYWYQSVENAQEFDVLSAASSILEAGLYSANAVFVNPQTTKRIGTLKGTDAHYIGVSRDAAGRLNMDGMPIISIPVIPAGWFLIGDFSQKNIEIREYTTMSIQFLEDITTKKTNSIVVLADEEIHLVKYNPKWYIYDRFSTAKTQLEKPDA